MQVERQHAVGAGAGDQVGDELGRDRRAARGAAVLPRIAEIGDHRRDAPRRGAHERIDHDQQFHQMIVGRIGGRLQDEDVLAAHVFLDLDEDFLVGEAPDAGLADRDVEIAGDRFGQHPVRIAREKFHAASLAKADSILTGLLAARAAIASGRRECRANPKNRLRSAKPHQPVRAGEPCGELVDRAVGDRLHGRGRHAGPAIAAALMRLAAGP